MVKVSIIVPVYNVENYLSRCIDSILNQTFEDFELILIDDGSKDESLKIIREYEKKDKRIHGYTQKNKGPALTRNRGIDLSKGKYLMFIDSDDYIEKDFVSKYYDAAIVDNYDLVIGGYRKVTGDHIDFIRRLNPGIFSKYIVMGPVCKLYKSSFIKNNNVVFLNTTASEDIYFNELAYSYNPTIIAIDDIGYTYYYNPNSISNTLHKGFNPNVDILGLVSNINYKTINDVTLNEYFIIRYLVWYLLYSGKTASSDMFLLEYNKLFNWLNKNISNYKKNMYLKKCPSGEIFKIHLIIKIFISLDKMHLVKLFSKIYCGGK